MHANVYLLVVAIASALVGLWLIVRVPSLAPRSMLGAAVCFGAAWIVPGFAVPLLNAAVMHMSIGLAILAAVFPTLPTTFVLVAGGPRYAVGRTDHAIR